MPQSKKVPFWRSLQTKFAMTYILIVAAVLILLNTYPVMVSQDLAYRSKETSMQNQAAVLASALATGPEALTAEGAARTVELLLGSLGVTRIVVTDPNGLVLCDFQEGTARTDTTGQYALFWELVTALQGNDVFRSDYADGVFHSRAAVPVTYRSMTQGAVYLYEYDAEQGAMLQGIQTNLRFISLVICLVTLVMGVVFTKALTRRIALLLGAIRTVREGEYSHRVSMGGGDELSRLADEFNELTGRLQTTEEVRRRFVSDASHELKTPLAIISANTGLLSASLGENQWLESTRAQVGRLDRLIQNLIELARTEEALPDEAAAPVPLGRVAERALEDFRPLAEAAGKTLDGRIEPELVLPGVEDNLARLCALLLDNAVKYCDEGGAIRLTLARRGRWAVLSVSNPCAGLDAAQLPRLFDRFYRADSSRARSSGGYGIGLSTARAIVARHHGRLTARLSGGTVTFTAVLPLFSRPPERFLHR